MDHQTAEALRAFTQRYCAVWQQQRHSLPRSEELYGVPSPCVVDTQGEAVFWQPQPFSLAQNISAVERAGMSSLNEGQTVSFDVVADRRTGKSAAENLRAA